MSQLSRVFLYVIYFIAVIGLGTVIIVSFTSKHSATPNKPASSSHQMATLTKPNVIVKTNQPVTPSPVTTSQPTSSGKATGALENTGPGNTMVVFVLASVIFALVYRQRIIYKLNH